jgi:AcrR family transcriptional regulator
MSPRTPKQFKEMREEKMTLIMDVALEQFANEGYFRTTINHIAKHAGISKGLIYNYFESKEALLSEIITRSVSEIDNYFDINKDGYLTEEEFEYFMKRIAQILIEKQSFWQLLFQLLIQKEVREHFLQTFLGSGSLFHIGTEHKEGLSVSGIMNTLAGYFIRKKDRKGPDYDPFLDLNMFIISLEGFALTYAYRVKDDEIYYERTINRLIELYK